MSQLVFDAEVAERLEVLYRGRDVVRRRTLVRGALDAQPGDRILDVGCGPGFYVADLVDEVEPGGLVVGVDGSDEMLAVAASRTAAEENAAFRHGDATALPVDDGAFDRALSVQVLEYVPDTAAALAELRRAVRPGGRVVVWDVDWSTVSWHSADPARMARVLSVWDGHLAHPALPRTLGARLRAAGFVDVRVEAHAFASTEPTEDTYGGVVFSFVEQYVAGTGSLPAQEVAEWADEQRALAASGDFFFACIQFCFTATRPAG